MRIVKTRHGTNRIADVRKGSAGDTYSYMIPPESWPNPLRMLKKKFVLPITFPRFFLTTKSAINAGYALFAKISATPKQSKHMAIIMGFP